jgi:hypothetical protein
MIELSIDSAANCTASITADGTEVTDTRHIREYYANANSSVLKKIQDKTAEFSETVGIKPVDVKCTECDSDFNILVAFDYASFFGTGS